MRYRVRTADEAKDAVRMLKRRGVDFFKVHDDTPREAYFAIAEEAGRQGLPFAGHVPREITFDEAIDPAVLPIRLFPFTRTGTQAREAPVQIDPTIAFGRPSLRGRAVPTAVLADRFKAGEPMTDLANDFSVTVEVIEEAIRCELDRAA